MVFVFDDKLHFQGLKSAQWLSQDRVFQPSAPARLNHICTLDSYASSLGTKTEGAEEEGRREGGF